MLVVNQNEVRLVGKLVSVKKVWSSFEHTSYEGMLQIIRDSGNLDIIPILFVDYAPVEDQFLEVMGQFRSRDIDNNGKLKVELYVYAKDIKHVKDTMYDNEVCIDGYVCKKPVIRTTPSGKQIADILIACNYGKDKTAYVPTITWGKCARKSGKFEIGTHVRISGRLQSRNYEKIINDVVCNKVAYELSTTSIEEVVD